MKVEGTNLFISFYYRNYSSPELNWNEKTYCVISKSDSVYPEPIVKEILAVGYSYCSRKDNYDKIDGRERAFLRAVGWLKGEELCAEEIEKEILKTFYFDLKTPSKNKNFKGIEVKDYHKYIEKYISFVLLLKEIEECERLKELFLKEGTPKMFTAYEQQFVDLLKSDRPEVVESSLKALANMQVKQARPMIKKVCKRTDIGDVRDFAVNVYKGLGRQDRRG